MGAAKNIFGMFGNVFDTAKTGITKVFKSTPLKTADSSVIKTTSKTLGSTTTPISGGRSVVKSLAQSTGTAVTGTARVGARIVPVALVAGGTALGATKLYNYMADEWAMTQAQREYQNQINLSNDETDAIKRAQDQQIKYITDLNKARNEGGASDVLGASGGADDYSGLFPIGRQLASGSDSGNEQSNSVWLVIGGIAVLATGAYLYSKNKKVKK